MGTYVLQYQNAPLESITRHFGFYRMRHFGGPSAVRGGFTTPYLNTGVLTTSRVIITAGLVHELI